MNRRDLVNYGLLALIVGATCLNGGLLVSNVLNNRYNFAVLNAIGLTIVLLALPMVIQTIYWCREIDQIQAHIDEINQIIQRMR
jgi:uncharacterized membrane protein YqgA involved in biofilm formation